MTSTNVKNDKKPSHEIQNLEALYESLSLIARSRNYDDIKRLLATGYLVESKLKDGPIALMSSVSIHAQRYKAVKLPLHDWIRLGGQLSCDYETPLEALEADV